MVQTFLYHALATGVSGNITLPFQDVIEVQAPSALPFTGGYSASRSEGFRYKHILSFSSARTVTTGSESGGFFNTLATATVEGLSILDVVTADRVVARLASKYSKDTREHSASFAGSHFDNLRIAGYRLDVAIDPERLKTPPRSEKTRFVPFAAPIDPEGCTGLELLEDGAIHLPEFGRIYLAESLVTACYQNICMLRVVLGCAVKGHTTIAHASTDGEPMPG
jgi:hypothetical protein